MIDNRGRKPTGNCKWLKTRLKLDITQQEMANIAGIHRQRISDIENGKHVPSAKTIIKICQHYKIAPSDLGFRIQPKTEQQAVKNSDFEIKHDE